MDRYRQIGAGTTGIADHVGTRRPGERMSQAQNFINQGCSPDILKFDIREVFKAADGEILITEDVPYLYRDTLMTAAIAQQQARLTGSQGYVGARDVAGNDSLKKMWEFINTYSEGCYPFLWHPPQRKWVRMVVTATVLAGKGRL